EGFDQPHDVFLADEGHLDVELRELGLAVGALRLVAEAAGNLEVAVEAGNNQQLFQLLWRLGEGVERSRKAAAGYEEVSGAFGCTLDQTGRLNLDEAAG